MHTPGKNIYTVFLRSVAAATINFSFTEVAPIRGRRLFCPPRRTSAKPSRPQRSCELCPRPLGSHLHARVMADELAQFSFLSAIRGHRVYMATWRPFTGEQLQAEREASNTHDRHAVAVIWVCPSSGTRTIVGHVPREMSVFFRIFCLMEVKFDVK